MIGRALNYMFTSEDPFPTHCGRCRKELTCSICSKFDTAQICLECEKKEREHPDYQEAVDAELRAVKRGDYNFPGIGCPIELLK